MTPNTPDPAPVGLWVVWTTPDGKGPTWAHLVTSTDPFATRCALTLGGDPYKDATIGPMPAFRCPACDAGTVWTDALFAKVFGASL